ncbi:dual-specificity protein phosphatase [Cardiosporidium cionae]|uniref:Dual-specificity protein phosphatase n=1 Tax=Cardiosporidium cionae TaxID=476202 RepID=A0ABQ7J786_9APIC|nr:dual-specificity protein phosphatase [Cardiosporidium cionae]|eukprot:KAF8819857.1 dual-specificity protein phosphatase [Cardiosporidium cionae]
MLDVVRSSDSTMLHSTNETTLLQYSCKSCRRALFDGSNIQPHMNHRKTEKRFQDKSPATMCASIFVEELPWMENLSEQSGKIYCPNPRCKSKVGSWCWHGIQCSCGNWQVPAFQIHKSKVDCFTVFASNYSTIGGFGSSNADRDNIMLD